MTLLAVGSMVGMVEDGKELIYKELGFLPTIVNARFIKPLDEIMIAELCKNHDKIITIEEGSLIGGFGSGVNDFMTDNSFHNELIRLGIPDKFIEHRDRIELLNEIGLSIQNILRILSYEFNEMKIYEH